MPLFEVSEKLRIPPPEGFISHLLGAQVKAIGTADAGVPAAMGMLVPENLNVQIR